MKKIIVFICVFSVCATLSWGQTWNLTETMKATLNNGVLTVTTTANAEAMPNYNEEEYPPWDYVYNNIHSVVIGDRITSVGDYTFTNYTGITSVTISNSVTSIGKYAFRYCPNLTSVTIPNSVTSIEENAFSSCLELTSIMIPNSVKSIGKNAFSYCNLTSVTIPNSVTHIGEAAFGCCPRLTNIQVDAGNTAYLSDNGILYNKSKTTLHTYPSGKIGTSFSIPASVTKIGNSAFYYCSELRTITIPNSVTEIEDNAFSACFNLISITIPNSVKSIGKNAFSSCNLTSVTIPNSVTYIGEAAFGGCVHLTNIQVDAGNTVCLSENGILYNKNKTTLYTYPAGKSGTSFTIPASVTRIGKSAFRNCGRLTSISIPNSVTEIGNDAFSVCNGLTSLTIPNSVTKIESFAFAGARFPSITIPNSVTEIEKNAFSQCSLLTVVTVEWTTPLSVMEIFVYVNTSTAILLVPTGTKALYEVADVWKDFGMIIEYNPTNTEHIEIPTLKAYATNGILYISGLQSGKPVSVYSISGQLVYKSVAEVETVQITLDTQGVYIIVAGNQTIKTIVK